ncbi:hypothetical protein JCM11251_005792 [Rhodosporidiobolus azoricus]
MLLLLILYHFHVMVAPAIGRPHGTFWHKDKSSSFIRSGGGDSDCVRFDPSTGETIFYREQLEQATAVRKSFCFRQLYYNIQDYEVSLEKEYRLPSGGKIWDSFGLDINSTAFFYLELCYDDFLSSKLSSIKFSKDLQEASTPMSTLASLGLVRLEQTELSTETS